jgi:hypothetical protein
MTSNHRFAAPILLANSSVLFTALACNVFGPPELDRKDSGALNSANGGGSGSGGAVAGSGGAPATGGTNATGGSNGSGSMTASNGGTDSGSGNIDASMDSGSVSGPTDPWWPTTKNVSVDISGKVATGTCMSEGMPTANDRKGNDPGDSITPLYFAIERFRISAVDEVPDPNNPGVTMLSPNPDAWKSIGFDIDGKCTNAATCQVKETLVTEKACENGQTVPFDGDNCIDNSMGSIFLIGATAPSVGAWFGLTEQDWDCEMWRGGMSNIYKVSNYNGKYNDDSVTVDTYTTIGVRTFPAWTCRKTMDSPLEPNWWTHSRWPTVMHWLITKDSISLSANPNGNDVPDSQYQDPTAYVRGGWLVFHPPDGTPLWLNGQRTTVPGFRQIMHRSVTAAQIVHDQQSDLWSLQNGTTAYVARPNEVLQSFRGIGFCENMCGTFDSMKNYLNTYQDVLATDVNAPASTPCDALSYGTAFHAGQITVDAQDVVDADPPVDCPQPRHPGAPRQGCVCSSDGSTCTLPGADGGGGAGGTTAATGGTTGAGG